MSDPRIILRRFQERLNTAVSQSPLLRLPETRIGRLLDLSRLEGLARGLPARILDAVIDRRTPVGINFSGRGPVNQASNRDARRPTGDVGGLTAVRQALVDVVGRFGAILATEPLRCRGLLLDFCPGNRGDINVLVGAVKLGVAGDLLAKAKHAPLPSLIASLTHRLRDDQGFDEQLSRWAVESWAIALGILAAGQGGAVEPEPPPLTDVALAEALFDLIERRIHRHAELARRETGSHALWLGYPVFSMRVADTGGQFLRAPLFFWPVRIGVPASHTKKLTIGLEDGGEPRVNTVLAARVRRAGNGVDLFAALGDIVADPAALSINTMFPVLAGVARAMNSSSVPSLAEPLQPLSGASKANEPALVSSAVLGYFMWPNHALLSDLESLARGDVQLGLVEQMLVPPAVEQADTREPAVPCEEDRYLVCESDHSQAAAVWQARAGSGLVLHGPPGTGKSQAIVNIIADAMARGKTVLMACQKRAATHVVLERLRRVGLADLCVEVHDAEADRQQVFSDVRKQVESLPTSTDFALRQLESERRALSARIQQVERELDGYASALREPHPSVGRTYGDVLAFEAEVRAACPSAQVISEIRAAIRGLTTDRLDLILPEVWEAGRLYQLAGIRRNIWSQRARQGHVLAASASEIAAAVRLLRDADARNQLFISQNPTSRALPEQAIPAIAQEGPQFLALLTRLSEEFSKTDRQLVRAWLAGFARGLTPASASAAVEAAKEIAKEASSSPPEASWAAALGQASPDRFRQVRADADRLLTYRGRPLRFFSSAYRRTAKAIHLLAAPVLGAGVDRWDAAESVLRYLNADERWSRLREVNQKLVPQVALKSGDAGKHTQFPVWADRCLVVAVQLWSDTQRLPWVRPYIDSFSRGVGPTKDELHQLKSTIDRAPLLTSLIAAIKGLARWLPAELVSRAHAAAVEGKPLRPLIDRLESSLANLDALAAWEAHLVRQDPVAASVITFLESHEALAVRGPGQSAPIPGEGVERGLWWTCLVRAAAVAEWRRIIESSHPEILSIEPASHAQRVKLLAELLAQKQSMEAAVIRGRWLTRQMPLRRHPWKKVFQLRSSKNGQAKRLREAIATGLPLNLLTLRPCWLVTPSIAAELFPLQTGMFDVVIFDEASQCPLEQAIPVLTRGRVAIVSGDEKQLPPTSFFAGRADDGEDDPEGEPAESAEEIVAQLHLATLREAEDLLQVAVGHFPERYLRVHYRSESPALIDFSNWAFYSGQLEIPPPPAVAVPAAAIRYLNVSGTYEERTNPTEAKQIVEILKQAWKSSPPSPGSDTFGVVTFNQPQRELILDLLAAEATKDADFAQRYALETARRDEGQDVGLFVKNLENVQGDERDIILFSTTFGHDRNGRFARRFGPLGAIGGERRLNVAVTRAKRSITIVSSMRIAEVAGALNRGDGQPVLTPAGYLQLYLAYAEGVSKGNASPVLDSLRALTYSQGPTGGNADRLVADVRAVLSDLGYLVETGGGSGGLSVDLAVRHPGHQKGYALGIDCDRLIKLGWATRFSHVWRPDVLLRRQWRLHQVWAHRWWGNRQAEIDQLRWAIDSATAEPVVEVATTSATTRSQSPPSSANQQFLPGYYSMEF